MQLLRLLLPTVLLGPTLATTGTGNTSYPFKDTSLPIERRLDDLGTLPEGTTVRPWLGYPAAVAFHSIPQMEPVALEKPTQRKLLEQQRFVSKRRLPALRRSR
jgi:hypothetical protein